MTYSSGAHVAVVDVDPASGRVTLVDYVVVHDSGRLINPLIVEGQIDGAVALGIGSALLEEIRYDDAGQPLAGTFMDWALARADDVPPLRIEHLETLSPLNPLGIKGVGESGSLPVPAVLASAIEDALAGAVTASRVCRSGPRAASISLPDGVPADHAARIETYDESGASEAFQEWWQLGGPAPKECRFRQREVLVRREGRRVILEVVDELVELLPRLPRRLLGGDPAPRSSGPSASSAPSIA